MDINAIVTLISTVGFPIVSCGAMGWYVKYITDQNNKRIDSLQEQHREENKNVIEALNNNTLVLQKLCDRMDNNGSNH